MTALAAPECTGLTGDQPQQTNPSSASARVAAPARQLCNAYLDRMLINDGGAQ